MARKKTREYHAKRILREALKRVAGIELGGQSVQVTPTTDWAALQAANAWLAGAKLVVKPDMLFGQRGKSGLVLLNATVDQAREFIGERMGKELEVKGLSDRPTHFIVEPFLPHAEEFYLSFSAKRYVTQINFSAKGGIDVEEHWDESMQTHEVLVGDALSDFPASFFNGVPEAAVPKLRAFITACFNAFADVDFTFLEMNPLCLDASGAVVPLDMRGEFDDTAFYKNQTKWGDIEFPKPWGSSQSPEEAKIEDLDSKTGASLKFTLLNAKGRVWPLVAGGGASVIYADTVFDYGLGEWLGNYGEYSGAPTDDDTYQYTRAVLSVATKLDEATPHKGRALLIGGGIANFTDVAITFRGIIQALMESAAALQAADFKIFVRRGGPNFEKALELMKSSAPALGVDVEVFGPDVNMTHIVDRAAEYIKQYDAAHAAGK